MTNRWTKSGLALAILFGSIAVHPARAQTTCGSFQPNTQASDQIRITLTNGNQICSDLRTEGQIDARGEKTINLAFSVHGNVAQPFTTKPVVLTEPAFELPPPTPGQTVKPVASDIITFSTGFNGIKTNDTSVAVTMLSDANVNIPAPGTFNSLPQVVETGAFQDVTNLLFTTQTIRDKVKQLYGIQKIEIVSDVVPEPASLALFLPGLAALFLARRRKRSV